MAVAVGTRRPRPSGLGSAKTGDEDRRETGARLSILLVAIASTVTVLVAFAFTTLVDEPATAVALVAILVISVVVDLLWKRSRDRAAANA